MDLSKISAGKNVPWDVNVVIEIPMNGTPVKYEVDKDSGRGPGGPFCRDAHVLPGQLRLHPQYPVRRR